MKQTHLSRSIMELRGRLEEIGFAAQKLGAVYSDEPNDLRDLARISIDIAQAVDTLFDEIGQLAGLSPAQRVDLCRPCMDGIDGNFTFRLNEAASEIDMEREPAKDARRDHGTLNHAQQGTGAR